MAFRKKLRSLAGLKLFLILAAVSIFSAEIAGQIILSLFHPSSWSAEINDNENLIFTKNWHTRFKASPYFGYVCDDQVVRHSYNGRCNNHGFKNEVDFPYKKNAQDEIVVAIFGGSVAENLTSYLTGNLGRYTGQIQKAFNAKKVTFLNLALGGYRQPQQLITAMYYAEMFDVAIVIDGQNEMSHPDLGKAYPFDFPVLTPRFYGSQAAVWFKDLLVSVPRLTFLSIHRASEAVSALRYSAIYFTMWKVSEKFYLWSSENINRHIHGENIGVTETLNQQRAEHWIRNVVKMYESMNALGKQLYHFVQPSPYLDGTKTFSKKEHTQFGHGTETKVAVETEKNRMRVRQEVYREVLADKGWSHSLEDVFQREEDTIYVDSCCHVNSRGHELIWKAIFKAISKNHK